MSTPNSEALDALGDLYLSSLESSRFEPVRRCEPIHRLQFATGKDAILVKVEPPVVGQDFGSADDIDVLLVTPRTEGGQLFPISEFPLFVYICLPITDLTSSTNVATDDVTVIAWGELYRTAEDAAEHRFG